MDLFFSMKVFVLAVDQGSFTAAAAQIGLSSAMVGKHIRFLEDRLGAALLTRTTRRQTLTEIGRQYYERCIGILADVDAAERSAQAMHDTPRGRLRISAPFSFGSQKLAPAIIDYLAAYPHVAVDLDINDQMVDLVGDGYDCAVRIGPLADSGLIARFLFPYQMVVAASPAYLSLRGEPQTPADLLHHECLGFSYLGKNGRRWNLGGLDGSPPLVSRFSTNNGQALRMAAVHGMGLVMQPYILLDDEIRAGRLVPVLADYVPPPRPVHLVYPSDRAMTAKTRSFIDFMLERFVERG